MDGASHLNDEAIDALLAGRGEGIDPALAGFVADLRGAYKASPPAMSPALAALVTDRESAVARANRRWRVGTRFAATAAAVAALVGTTGGLAAAGELPAPVQTFAAHTASHLGIHLPAAPGSHPESPPAPAPVASTTVAPPTTTTPPTSATTPTSVTVTTRPQPSADGPPKGGVGADHNARNCGHSATTPAADKGTTATRPCPASHPFPPDPESPAPDKSEDHGPKTADTGGHQGGNSGHGRTDH